MVPHVLGLLPPLALLQPGFVQELMVPGQKVAGTPGLQEAAGRDKRNPDKVALCQWVAQIPGAEGGCFSLHASVQGRAG